MSFHISPLFSHFCAMCNRAEIPETGRDKKRAQNKQNLNSPWLRGDIGGCRKYCSSYLAIIPAHHQQWPVVGIISVVPFITRLFSKKRKRYHY